MLSNSFASEYFKQQINKIHHHLSETLEYHRIVNMISNISYNEWQENITTDQQYNQFIGLNNNFGYIYKLLVVSQLYFGNE